jgi:chorismate lyase
MKNTPIWKTPPLSSYLANPRSCTEQLKKLSHDRVSIDLVFEGWGEQLPGEANYLSIPTQESCWLRHTFWYNQGAPWLLARAVLPYGTLAQDKTILTQLGNQPIGEIIYRQPGAQREHIEVAPLAQTPYDLLFKMMADIPSTAFSEQQWVRRSLLYFHQKPILIVEVFLHELDQKLSHSSTTA